MPSTEAAHTLPMFALSTLVNARGDDGAESSSKERCHASSDSETISSTASTCSVASGPASEASEDEEGRVGADASSRASRLRWADCESDEEDFRCVPLPISQHTEGARLSTCARCATPEVVMKGAYRLEFAKVVAAGLLALRSSPMVAVSGVQEEKAGWTLTCSLLPYTKEAFSSIQAVSNQVKAAFLHAAEESSNVYVVGYAGAPFAPLGLGFCLQLAVVQDETSACWDLLGSGHCARRGNCRWQHPGELVSVEVCMRM